MIVTDANAFMRAVHNRMPVLLDRPGLEAWLSGAAGPEVLRPAAEDRLRMWPVSRRVNGHVIWRSEALLIRGEAV
jgi:putative SOS response-associated peptidase YedK